MKYETTTHIHLLETIYQKLFGLRIYGKSAVKHLDEIGFLGHQVVCGHSIWLTEEDVDVLENTGTNVCHNASSNLRLLSGIAPVPYLLEKGIKVALGTDDMGMNDDKDMLQEMRLVLILEILVQRGKDADVDTVIVDGEVVMKNKTMTKIDKDKLYREIRDALDRPLTKDEEDAKTLALEVYPHLKRFYYGSINGLDKPFSQYNSR